jgi:hypothetical protein
MITSDVEEKPEKERIFLQPSNLYQKNEFNEVVWEVVEDKSDDSKTDDAT